MTSSVLPPPAPPDPEPAPTATIPRPSAERGALVIAPRAVQHIAARVVRDTGAGADAEVSVEKLEETIELAMKLSLPYPSQSLSSSIEPVRQAVVDRVGRLVGRPVTRLDVQVTSFTVPPPVPARRVR